MTIRKRTRTKLKALFQSSNRFHLLSLKSPTKLFEVTATVISFLIFEITASRDQSATLAGDITTSAQKYLNEEEKEENFLLQ